MSSDSHVELSGREKLVNAAMEALARHSPVPYDNYKITNQETVKWLHDNKKKIANSFNRSNRNFLINCLEDGIAYVNDVKSKKKPSDGLERPTIEEMRGLISELQKEKQERVPVEVPAAPAVPMDPRLARLMEILQDNAQKIPEGEFLEGVNALKSLYDGQTKKGGSRRRRASKHSKKHMKSKKSKKSRRH